MVSTRAVQRLEALAVALAGAATFVVWLVAIIASVDVLGVRIEPLLTGAGLIGVALGFGAQSLVDGTVWHVPNGQIQLAGNMSQHWSRALLDIQIAFDSDIDRAREAIKRVADEIWHEDRATIEEPEVWGVQSLGPAGITLRLVAKTKPLEQWRITRVMRERIKAELDREGIEVPSPAPWNPPEPAGSARALTR